MELTTVERRLIGLLQENARMSNKDLAQAAGIAESTCHEKVRSLQSRGIIRGFHADVDLRALGRSIRALITVRLQPKSTLSVNAFHDHILRATETLAIDTITGSDDFIIEVAVPDVERLQTFVLEHITSRTDVADARTSLVYEHDCRFVLDFLDSSPFR